MLTFKDIAKLMIDMNLNQDEEEQFPFNRGEAMSLAPLIGLDTGPNNSKHDGLFHTIL